MSSLLMKYFVLKPRGNDSYSNASRQAMLTYAKEIEAENPLLAVDLCIWVDSEINQVESRKVKKDAQSPQDKACKC